MIPQTKLSGVERKERIRRNNKKTDAKIGRDMWKRGEREWREKESGERERKEIPAARTLTCAREANRQRSTHTTTTQCTFVSPHPPYPSLPYPRGLLWCRHAMVRDTHNGSMC